VTAARAARLGVELQCRLVAGPDELAAHREIRRAVFVAEQHVFADSDADVHDEDPSTLHVLGLVDGVPAGAVRLFPLDGPGLWQGDRLAVLPPFRAAGLGAPLVRFAVGTAGELGGTRMIAHVQPANEVFFRRLGWRRRGEPELYVGIPHLLMDIYLRPGVPGA
jgi:putative N-acetyltransferase (TIGR04045 family)